MRPLRAWLHRFARSSFGGFVIHVLLSRFSFALPLKRLRETDSLIAFHHPDPAYPLHILLVPRKPYSSWTDVSPEDTDFLQDLARVSQDLIQTFNLEEQGYRLIVNGGRNQEVAHLHIHLISETEATVKL